MIFLNVRNCITCLICCCLPLLIACVGNDQQEVIDLINKFYVKRESFARLDKALISAELIHLIDSAKQKEFESEKKIAISEFPTDKPLIIEGDIFTGLYEGATAHKIITVEILDNSCVVKVQFTNEVEGNVSWQDEIHLVKEIKWRIDNVVYGQENLSEAGNLKQLLRNFNSMEL